MSKMDFLSMLQLEYDSKEFVKICPAQNFMKIEETQNRHILPQSRECMAMSPPSQFCLMDFKSEPHRMRFQMHKGVVFLLVVEPNNSNRNKRQRKTAINIDLT